MSKCIIDTRPKSYFHFNSKETTLVANFLKTLFANIWEGYELWNIGLEPCSGQQLFETGRSWDALFLSFWLVGSHAQPLRFPHDTLPFLFLVIWLIPNQISPGLLTEAVYHLSDFSGQSADALTHGHFSWKSDVLLDLGIGISLPQLETGMCSLHTDVFHSSLPPGKKTWSLVFLSKWFPTCLLAPTHFTG